MFFERKSVRKLRFRSTLICIYPLLHVYHSGAIFHSVRYICRLHCLCPDGRNESQLSKLEGKKENEYLADFDTIDTKLSVRMCLLGIQYLFDCYRAKGVSTRTLAELEKPRGKME